MESSANLILLICSLVYDVTPGRIERATSDTKALLGQTADNMLSGSSRHNALQSPPGVLGGEVRNHSLLGENAPERSDAQAEIAYALIDHRLLLDGAAASSGSL
jgi:hypothetical protein